MNRFFCIVTLLFALTACGERIEPGQSSKEPAVVKGLATTVAEAAPAPARLALPGTLESIDRGELAARIPGQVVRILVNKGQQVKAGDALLQIGSETAGSELQSAAAAVTAAERRVAEANSVRDLAEATFARYARLRDARAVTPHEFDKAQADRAAAVARLAAAEAELAASGARREAARTMAAQAQLRAPYAGTVAELLVDPGSTVLPGMPLLALDRSGPLRVKVALPERLAVARKAGDRLQVEIPAAGKTLAATLAELQPNADPASRTVTVWLALPEDAALRGGQYARVLLDEGAGLTTLMLPTQAVVTRGQLTGVYVVENDILHYRMVKTGTVHADRIEILTGLKAGEEVAVGELALARHGARLERSR